MNKKIELFIIKFLKNMTPNKSYKYILLNFIKNTIKN
jgi:hypothetical protein